jgi:hypothetical protein
MYKFLLFLLAALGCPTLIHANGTPQLLDCNLPVKSCDIYLNNPLYWNHATWWNNMVQNHPRFCEGNMVKVCAETAAGEALDETLFEFNISSPGLPPSLQSILGSCGTTQGELPPGTEVVVTASRDLNPLMGFNQSDLLIIQQHIDGTDLFDSPYQWIAADANNDQVIDSLDILECRKIMLGIWTEMPTFWRFVDKNYVFPTPNPLSSSYPESISVNSNDIPAIAPVLVGVQMCDLTNGNIVGFYDLVPDNQHLIGSPQPNPTTGSTMLPLQLIENENVLLEVLDVSGRMVFRSEMTLPAGPALLEIPNSDLYQTGVFVWRVQAGSVSKSGRIVRN